MRTPWAVCVVALGVLIASATASAQRALSTAMPSRMAPTPLLTLRPSAELRGLAIDVAEVLELRTGARVEVGEAPPPGLMEAVPAGHVALALQGDSLVLVLGAAGGLSHDTSVKLSRQSGQGVDARSVALAVEALRDLATELARELPSASSEVADAPMANPYFGQAGHKSEVAPQAESRDASSAAGEPRDGGDGKLGRAGLFSHVNPLLFARVYSGASSASSGPRAGVGAGLGLCVLGHCLFVLGEVPMQLGPPTALDARYEYTTFASGFYSRPLRLGDFTPGASVGFFTRVGRFEQDMGLANHDLQTDLGVRGTLELAYEIVGGLDLMAEGGADVTLDRLNVGQGGTLLRRVDPMSPWLQGAVRYRL